MVESIVVPVESYLTADVKSRCLHSQNLHRTFWILASGVVV